MNEDAVLEAIGEFRSDIKNLGREIRELKSSIEKRDENCRDCRREIDKDLQLQADFLNQRIDIQDKKITPLAELHNGEKAVASWWDSNVTRGGIIGGVLLGLVGLFLQLRGGS